VKTFLCFPKDTPSNITEIITELGYETKCTDEFDLFTDVESPEGFLGVLVTAGQNEQKAIDLCREIRSRETPLSPVILVVQLGLMSKLDQLDDLFDECIIEDATAQEIKFRIIRSLKRFGKNLNSPVISYGPLALNLETYQAVVEKKPLDLTYMEYELLRFLVQNPGKVFTRDTLLTRVWGYEYFGGARTVDVHIRRLRAKLGEEHAGLIETVRSVGYRFGRIHW
jgi:DNA-binding response OmpR family regulator